MPQSYTTLFCIQTNLFDKQTKICPRKAPRGRASVVASDVIAGSVRDEALHSLVAPWICFACVRNHGFCRVPWRSENHTNSLGTKVGQFSAVVVRESGQSSTPRRR